MTHTNSVTISLGTGDRRMAGIAYWDRRRQSYAALLRLFEGDPVRGTGPGADSDYPPAWARFGLRTAEFVTPDALVNHLAGCGLELDDDSLLALQWLRHRVAAADGGAELLGLVGPDGRRQLHLVTPSRRLLAVRPRLDHDDYRLHWGDAGPATVETARLICEHAFVRRPSSDVEPFALALTYEYLADVEGDFSLDVNALCDWFLTDSELTTGLSRAQRAQLRAVAGLDAAGAPQAA